MSTSLLYHGFGIRGYKHLRTEYVGREVVFTIRQERDRLRCPACGGRNVHPHGQVKRRFKTVPIGGKPVSIVFPVPRVSCPACSVVRQIQIGFADRRRSYTKSFQRYALDLSRHMTIQDVAEHLNIGWDVIKDIQKRDLTRRFARPKLKHLRKIAIDEISIRKGHRYLTVVLDLQNGAVVFVGDGKGADALVPFWKRVRQSGARIEAVAMDMSAAYIAAVSAHLPEAAIVFDHFHVVKLFNEKLSNLRRDLYREATDKMHKDVLKGTRWLLLKNPDNLNPDRKEAERLQEALRLNQPLALAYYMKEELRLLWSKTDKEEAEAFLADWLNRAMVSGVRMLMKFAKTLAAHRTGILAYYDYPISTAPLEGTNNKIKTMKRQAYGFRDQEFFKLKILALHETKYALVG